MRSPKWVIGHVVIAVVVIVCVTLGFWQLDRRSQRRAENERVTSRIAETQPLPETGFASGSTEALRYRGVEAIGRFDPDHEFLVRYRSHEGLPGYGVITPLVTADGVVLVDRGWVPLEMGERWPVPDAAAPSDEVRVEGWLAAPHRSRVRPVAPTSDAPGYVGDVAAPQLRPLLPYDRLYELTLVALGPADRFPAPVGLPEIGEGPHLSYAFQWFSFAAIALIGWSAVVVSARRGPSAGARRRDEPSPASPVASP